MVEVEAGSAGAAGSSSGGTSASTEVARRAASLDVTSNEAAARLRPRRWIGQRSDHDLMAAGGVGAPPLAAW